MKVSFEGIGEMTATFLAEEDNKLKPGDAACMTGSNQVGLGKDGDAPCGVAVSVAQDGCIGVQIGGLAEAAFSGTAPAVGWNNLASDGAGCVKIPDKGGIPFLVVSVDEDNGTAVIKL